MLVFYAFRVMFKRKNERMNEDDGIRHSFTPNFDMKIDESKEVSIGASF